MNSLVRAITLVLRCDRGLFWRRMAYVLLQNLLPVASLIVLKQLVDAVAQAATAQLPLQQVLTSALLLGGIYLLRHVAEALSRANADIMAQRVTDHISGLVQQQSARLDMAYYDTPAYYDTLHRAQQEGATRPMAIVGAAVSLVGSLVALVGVGAVVAMQAPLAAMLMLLAAAPEGAIRMVKAKKVYTFRRHTTPAVRQAAYYTALLTAKPSAAEVRSYATAPFFRERYVAVRRAITDRLTTIARRQCGYDLLCALLQTVALLLALALMLRQALAGAITVGTFVMLFEAFRRGLGYLHTAVGSAATLYDSRLFLSNLFEFLQLQPQAEAATASRPMPETIDSIELRDVSFAYPGSRKPVLSHFNLIAPRGQVTRVQGRNGLGKSTLVKLLLRFYSPASGTITVGGADLATLDLHQWRDRIGVMFQDFVRYNCTVAEVIALGRANQHIDMQRVRRAAAMAGADTFIEQLPQGYDNMLGRMFEGGAELSAGQWQTLAWARLLYRDPEVIILDEPTAWLDPKGRQRLMQTLDQLKDNRIIILISHNQ